VCQSVLALILIVPYGQIEFPLLVELVGGIGKYRPSIIVLAVREECLAGVGRDRIRRIDDRGVVDAGDAQAPIRQISRGDEALGVKEVRARDPGESRDHRGGEAQLLADGLYIDELALALIEGSADCRRHTCRGRVHEGGGHRPKIVGIAGVDFLGVVVVRDRGNRSIP